MFTSLKSFSLFVINQKIIIFFFLVPIYCYPQSKNTQFGRDYSHALFYGEVIKTTTTKFKVNVKKKWNPKKIRKKKNKISVIEHQLENKLLKSIKNYYLKNDSLTLINSQFYDKKGNLSQRILDYTDPMSKPLIIKHIYNNQGNIDSTIHYRGPKCTSIVSFVYNNKGEIQSEYKVGFTRRLDTISTQKIYDYRNNKISTVSYFQNKKDKANIIYHYNYDEKKLLKTINNFNYQDSKLPDPLFPKTIVYQYDKFSNITKEKLFWSKNIKSVYEYIYEYDEIGNWISQIIIWDGKIIGYYERNIKYKN